MPWRPRADLLALLELAAPSACAGCARPGSRCCPACAGSLRGVQPRVWRPTPCPAGMPPTWAGPAYDGPVRALVVAWKEQDRVDLTPLLADVLRAGVRAALRGSAQHAAAVRDGIPVAVVPAPSAWAGTRARGRAPVRELAVAATRPDAVVDALRLTRRVRDQAGLGAQERAANLGGAVGLAPGAARVLRALPVLLVDDVVTTGATLVECARALREAGAGPVVAVTVAATVRRGRTAPSPALPSPPVAD